MKKPMILALVATALLMSCQKETDVQQPAVVQPAEEEPIEQAPLALEGTQWQTELDTLVDTTHLWLEVSLAFWNDGRGSITMRASIDDGPQTGTSTVMHWTLDEETRTVTVAYPGATMMLRATDTLLVAHLDTFAIPSGESYDLDTDLLFRRV